MTITRFIVLTFRDKTLRVDSSILYSRLFGKGKENIYEFDDHELQRHCREVFWPKIREKHPSISRGQDV